MERREGEVQALLLNGEDMLARCREGESRQLRDNLKKLNERMYDTREKAERKRVGLTPIMSPIMLVWNPSCHP